MQLKKYLLRLYLIYTKLVFQNMSAKESMRKIYLKKWWGGKAEFYSGRGSHDSHIIDPYINFVIKFVEENKISSIVDLGCGDFNIGSKIYKYVQKYIAIDVVPELVEFNRSIYRSDNLHFLCLDAIEDQLPPGDIILIRQVLQHLTNSEIQSILKKLSSYKFVFITEGIPQREFLPNRDHFHGPDIRLSYNSGVVVHDDPFLFNYTTYHEVLRIPDFRDEAFIVTTVYKLAE